MSNPWSAFYWRDYVADTGHLTLAEHGAYLLLMAHYYMTGKPIPSDPKQLRRIGRARTRKDASIIGRILVEFFTRDGHSYRHARIDREFGIPVGDASHLTGEAWEYVLICGGKVDESQLAGDEGAERP